MSDHYRTLGLQPNASKTDIKNAYFRLAHRYHPDHHAQADAAGRAAAAAAFRRAKDAYDVLSDDSRRAEYDGTIRHSSSAKQEKRAKQERAKPKAEQEKRAKQERAKPKAEQEKRGTSSSSTASNGHGHGGPRSQPPPRAPWPMAGGTALVGCCAALLGGSALLWMYNKRFARKQQESYHKEANDEKWDALKAKDKKWEALKAKWKAEYKMREALRVKRKAEDEMREALKAKGKAEDEMREALKVKRKAEGEMREAERAKWKAKIEMLQAETAKWKAEGEMLQAKTGKWKAEKEKRDRATSFSANWESEWALLAVILP